VSINCK